jgi:PKD repeat protein
MPSNFRRIPTLHRTVLATFTLAAALVCSLAATQAQAADGPQYGSIGQYGELTHFGGFDTTAYDNETYGGALTAGEFLNPVGFAVDTQDKTPDGDGTAIYVLDRVSDWGDELTDSTPTEWRLQKLSDTGAVLGSTEFTLPNPSGASSALGVNSPTGVLGLAIDDSTGTIYTLIYGTVGSGDSATPEAEEIIGWSTTVPTSGPNSGQLVAPSGSNADAVSTPVSPYSAPAVFSTANQLESSPLYDPQGLALDVTGGQDYLAIEADGTARSSTGSPQGPTVVEQVSPSSGLETSSWLSTSLLTGVTNSSGAPDANATAAGISTASDGSLDVLLNTTIGGSVLDAVDLPASLAQPLVLASSDIDPSNADAAPLVVSNSSGNHVSAGPQAVELSNGLFASDFYENTGGAGYFNQGVNEGVRLVAPEAGGVLSNPDAPATSIFDTLGNSSPSGSCYIGDGGLTLAANNVSLAAGANGAVWVLTSGQDSSAAPNAAADGPYTTGRELIELSPAASAADACAGPTGTFTVANGNETAQAATSPLKVSAGATVNFDASTIAYPPGASISAYEWDPTGSGSFTTISDALTVGGFQPPATASYQYTTPGVYSPELNLLGDFGDYQETGSITVLASSPPTAAFTAPATAQTGQSVSFDASGSQHASGAQIVDYHWSFGDGSTDDTQSATDTHTYTTAGTYTVTLTVRDNDTQSSTPVSQTITVSSPSSGGGGNTGGGGTTTTPTTTTPTATTTTSTGPPAAIIDRSPTNVSPKVSESGDNLVVTVTCPATKVSCAGTAAVKTAGAVAAGAAKSGKAKKKILTLGQATFSLSGGQRETLTIKISSTGVALLKKSKRLKVLVVVSAHDSYGDPSSKTLTFTLTTPSKKK